MEYAEAVRREFAGNEAVKANGAVGYSAFDTTAPAESQSWTQEGTRLR